MSQPTTGEQSSVAVVQRSTAHASLAALGVHLHHLDLFGPIRQQVHIAQKTVRYTPVDKLYDAFIALLAGVQGLVEINGRVRPDPALQAAGERVRATRTAAWPRRDRAQDKRTTRLHADGTTPSALSADR